MRTMILTLRLLWLAGAWPGLLWAHEPADAPPACTDGQIGLMILGTYHMSNPGLDAIATEADDVLSPRRQEEIAAMVEGLARFQPDAVLVEAPFGDDRVTDRYAAYLRDEIQLSRNETEQIGFRLARALSHPAVHPVDYPMFQDGTAYEFYVAIHPEAKDLGQAYRADWPRLADADARRLRTSTVSDYLAYVNGADHWSFGLDTRYVLATSIRLAEHDQYAGADLLTSWYKRNLRILTNVHRSLGAEARRAVLLVGHGHNRILWELVDTSPLLCRIDPRPFLTERAAAE